MECSKQGTVKGVPSARIEGIQKGCLFPEKWYAKGKGLDLEAESPRIKI